MFVSTLYIMLLLLLLLLLLFPVICCICLLSEPITLPPDYNPNAKKENKLYDVRRVSEISPQRPPTEEIVDTLVVDWSDQTGAAMAAVTPGEGGVEQMSMLEHPKMAQMRKGSNCKKCHSSLSLLLASEQNEQDIVQG